MIKILGRWSSMAYEQYTRPSTMDVAAVSRYIAGSLALQSKPPLQEAPATSGIAHRQQTPSWNSFARVGHE